MTREQAEEIITQALVTNGSSYVEVTLSRHIATALDALGLLAYAADLNVQPHPPQDITEQENLTVDRMTEEELLKGLEIAAPPVATRNTQECSSPSPDQWAWKRDRGR